MSDIGDKVLDHLPGFADVTRVSSTLTFGTTHSRHANGPQTKNLGAIFLPANGYLWPRCGQRFWLFLR
jgi:hypothetical protein